MDEERDDQLHGLRQVNENNRDLQMISDPKVSNPSGWNFGSDIDDPDNQQKWRRFIRESNDTTLERPIIKDQSDI